MEIGVKKEKYKYRKKDRSIERKIEVLKGRYVERFTDN